MEGSLHDLLVKSGVNSSTIDVLESEIIVTKEIFFSLGDSHFQHILPELKVGQYALLLNIWQESFGFSRLYNGWYIVWSHLFVARDEEAGPD